MGRGEEEQATRSQPHTTAPPRILDPAIETPRPTGVVEGHCEIAEGIRRVRGPVVQRVWPKHLALAVIFAAIQLERVDAARAFARIEPAAGAGFDQRKIAR